jgi:hypothetical protein
MWYIPEGSISICNVSAWVRTLHECAQRFSGSLMFHIISRHSDVRATVTHVPNRATQCQPIPQHIQDSCCVFVYLWCIERTGSLVISVGFRNRLRADRPGNCRMIPERDRNIYILYLVQNCSGSTQSPTQCVREEGGEWKGRRVKLTTLAQLRTLRKIGGCVSTLRTSIHAW